MYSAKYKENEMLPLWETVKINCHHKRSISKQLHACRFVTSYAIFFFFFAIVNLIGKKFLFIIYIKADGFLGILFKP